MIDDENEEEIEPGNMRVSEIKSELNLRGVDYSDCFDKESLSKKLTDARINGKSDPSVLDKFNKQMLENNIKGKSLSDINDEDISTIVGGDGNLPGGMSPDKLKNLLSNPELVAMLQSTKMQEVMKLSMTGGQDALQEAMNKDPEVKELVQKLNKVMMD